MSTNVDGQIQKRKQATSPSPSPSPRVVRRIRTTTDGAVSSGTAGRRRVVRSPSSTPEVIDLVTPSPSPSKRAKPLSEDLFMQTLPNPRDDCEAYSKVCMLSKEMAGLCKKKEFWSMIFLKAFRSVRSLPTDIRSLRSLYMNMCKGTYFNLFRLFPLTARNFEAVFKEDDEDDNVLEGSADIHGGMRLTFRVDGERLGNAEGEFVEKFVDHKLYIGLLHESSEDVPLFEVTLKISQDVRNTMNGSIGHTYPVIVTRVGIEDLNDESLKKRAVNQVNRILKEFVPFRSFVSHSMKLNSRPFYAYDALNELIRRPISLEGGVGLNFGETRVDR